MEGAKAYVQDADGAWQKATVVAALGAGRYRVQLEPWEEVSSLGAAGGSTGSGEISEVDASAMEGHTLPFQNANMPDNGFPNMTTLDHLHEAAILHNLRVRFLSGCPYTYTADIVIALNPYRWIPHLYTEEMRKEYLVFDRNKVPPHVYATSSTAYSGLRETRKDQSVLVSGESGAGKTETVKILMGHLAFIASSEDSQHIKRIVESNPLLESFGNAQTVRNDNSSRFGKFIELQLDNDCRLAGSQCRTYLLEKSRVIGQDAGERNYHIFYQMLASDSREQIGLGNSAYTRDTMRYTKLGASKTDTIEGLPDGKRFQVTKDALALVGVEGDLLIRMMRALAGVLLMGQIDFSGKDESSSISDTTRPAAEEIASVLEVDVGSLGKALTNRTIKMRNESVVKPLPPEAAVATRDAVAKELYARLFDWLVGRICVATRAPPTESKHFVGLLDIFGFESFAINRFEQLCINYANEKLQQKFTSDVFKAVQQEYADEGIPWDRIEFKDNAKLLELIESKLGIVAMLNEEGVRPKGSDENFVSKLSTCHKEEPYFSRPKLGALKEVQFSIRHYAGTVMYTATGWLERNKDAVSDDVTGLLRSSSNTLIAEIFAEPPCDEESSTDGPARGKMGSNTVVTKFKTSLALLMETIGQTSTQYVRCIKPNKVKSPSEMYNTMVVEQLRCAGVIEAIRISRAGFPARMPLKEFMQRFRLLVRVVAGVGFRPRGAAATAIGGAAAQVGAKTALTAVEGHAEPIPACRAIVGALLPGEGKQQQYEVGRTRVYFKSGVLEQLEERRALVQQAAATELVRQVRGQQARRHFLRQRGAALLIQATERMRRERSSYWIQRAAVIACQAHRRAVLARREVVHLRRERNATRLQSFHRRRVAMRELSRARFAAVRLQAAARRKACRRQYLLDLADHKEQAKLENQVKMLQVKLAEQERAAKEAWAAANAAQQGIALDTAAAVPQAPPPEDNPGPSVEMLEALNALTAENQKLRQENEKHKAEIEKLRKENQQLRAEQSTRGDLLKSMMHVVHKQEDGLVRRSPGSGDHSAHLDGDLSHSFITPTKAAGRRNSKTPDVTAVPQSSTPASGSNSKARTDEGKESGRLSVKHDTAGGFQLYMPLSHFWEDVPHGVLPLLKNGSEVHLKVGENILFVDEQSNHIMWAPWMCRSRGYRMCMGFFIERWNSGAVFSREGADPTDCSLGQTFTLRATITSKYVQVGPDGMFSRRVILRATGQSQEEATVFKLVPQFAGSAKFRDSEEANNAEDYVGALLCVNDNRLLRLLHDGLVAPVLAAEAEQDSRNPLMAFSMEYLLPRDQFEVVLEEESLGVMISRDLPLRVVGFRNIPSTKKDGKAKPGPAEKGGRIHVGDTIISVNGQNIDGIPVQDAIMMMNLKRPVTIGFTAARDASGALPTATSPAQDGSAAAKQQRSSLFSFAARKKAQALETATKSLGVLQQRIQESGAIEL